MSSKKKVSNDLVRILFLMKRRVFSHVSIPLPINQFAVLAVLSDEENMTFSEMGQKLSIIKQQLSPLINRLENDGLVERIPDSQDRRRVRLRLTGKGQTFINAHQNQIKARLETTLSSLSEREIEEFDKSLQTMITLFSKLPV